MKKKAQQVFNREQHKFWKEALKPKPKWCPWFLWIFLLKLVLKIEDVKEKHEVTD